tara:strand:+ start:2886 stop:3260 length:375 start_codon:yes stop_codon:yes gene_type:complete
MVKQFLIISALGMFLGVALGAFGAHGLKQKISQEMLDIWNTAVLYHMLHCLGLAIVALSFKFFGNTHWFLWSGWALIIGILIFSGSLYILALSGVRWLGAITPFGGLSLLAGWALFALALYKSN